MKELICIVCPNGCNITLDDQNKVSGNMCKRGEDFARQEFTCPKRSLCTTIRTTIKNHSVVPVKTDREINKDKILPVMQEINNTILTQRLGIGEIVIENVLGTGANIILTTNDLKGE